MPRKSDYKNLERVMRILEEDNKELNQLQKDVKNLKSRLESRMSKSVDIDYSTEIDFEKMTKGGISQILNDLNLPKSGTHYDRISRLKDIDLDLDLLTVSSLKVILRSFNLRVVGKKAELKERLEGWLFGEFVNMDKSIADLENKLIEIEKEYGYEFNVVEENSQKIDELMKKINQIKKNHFEGDSLSEYQDRWTREQSKERGGQFNKYKTGRGGIFSFSIFIFITFTILFLSNSSNPLIRILFAMSFMFLIFSRVWLERPNYIGKKIEEANAISRDIEQQFLTNHSTAIEKYKSMKEEMRELSKEMPSETQSAIYGKRKLRVDRRLSFLKSERKSFNSKAKNDMQIINEIESSIEAKSQKISELEIKIENEWASIKEFIPFATQLK